MSTTTLAPDDVMIPLIDLDAIRLKEGRDEKRGFTVITQDGVTTLAIHDSRISQILHQLSVPSVDGDEDEMVYALEAMLSVASKIEEINYSRPDREVAELISWLDIADITSDAKRMSRISEGLVTFNEIAIALRPGMDVYVNADRPFGGRITAVDLRHTFTGSYYRIQLAVISGFNAKGVERTHTSVNIGGYSGFRRLSALPVRPLSDAQRARLTERGRIFNQFAHGPSYASYEGHIIIPSWFGERRFRADGRVMIDAASMARFESSVHSQLNYNFESVDDDYDDESDHSTASLDEGIPESDLWMTWPTLPAFSYAAKLWGEIEVESLRPVDFREDAFDKLVLEPKLKSTMLALVKHAGHAFADIVDSKSGGCIFLLHGEPGLGKTLTAEAIAEYLHRPLYSISIGELGTTPEKLEAKLREILDITQRWNAVLLLDEADIFLAQRTEDDIVRNAMVGVFLRLLEYHNGVLLLTSNLASSFDKAFFSRISLVVRYPELDYQTRTKVWTNLLSAANVSGIDVSRLAGVDLNGRQIKNALRLAQTLALAEGVPVSEDHFEIAVELTQRAVTDLKS